MARVHLAPHGRDVVLELRLVARRSQDRFPLGLERHADIRIARHEARARQRLVLPGPRIRALVLPEPAQARYQEALGPVGPQAQIGVVELAGGGRAREPRVEPLAEPRVAQLLLFGRRIVGGDVEQEHEVEIGRVAELLSPELAVADDGEPGRRRGATREVRPTGRERRFENDVRQHRQVVRQPLDGQAAEEVLREQAKGLRMLEMAQHVHLMLGIVRPVAKQPRELGPPRVPIGLGEQRARVEQLVEQQRIAGEVVRRPGGRAHDVDEAGQERRMLDHEREVRAAPGDGLEERQQSRDDHLRAHEPGLRRGSGEQLRHERIESFAGGGGSCW